MGAYKTIIEVQNDDGSKSEYELDLLKSRVVSTSSELTSYPTVDGDYVADHMYRVPINLSLTGTFSSIGNKARERSNGKLIDKYINYDSNVDRLTNVQEIFEAIKNGALLCKITNVSEGDRGNVRFKQRDNMVLKDINWDEGQNTIGFDFTFREARIVKSQVVDELTDWTDETLDSITTPQQLDFTETLLDYDWIDAVIIDKLYADGMIEEKFLNDVLLCSGIIAAGVGSGILMILTATTTVGAATGPVGWVIGGIATAMIALGYGIYKIVEACKLNEKRKQYKIEQFKYYEDDRKRQKEEKRFTDFLGNIHNHLELLENSCMVYGFSKDGDQECQICLDNNYYTFEFVKMRETASSKDPGYFCRLYSLADDGYVEEKAIIPLNNISECKSSNYFARTKYNKWWIYFINTGQFDSEKYDQNANPDEYKMNSDLTNLSMFVTKVDMSNFEDMLKEIILNAVLL